jgi:hypothetical protein
MVIPLTTLAFIMPPLPFFKGREAQKVSVFRLLPVLKGTGDARGSSNYFLCHLRQVFISLSFGMAGFDSHRKNVRGPYIFCRVKGFDPIEQ